MKMKCPYVSISWTRVFAAGHYVFVANLLGQAHTGMIYNYTVLFITLTCIYYSTDT
ncbi:hypothetical protein Hanom_Chr06g00519881 [Helianthus anomalus]